MYNNVHYRYPHVLYILRLPSLVGSSIYARLSTRRLNGAAAARALSSAFGARFQRAGAGCRRLRHGSRVPVEDQVHDRREHTYIRSIPTSAAWSTRTHVALDVEHEAEQPRPMGVPIETRWKTRAGAQVAFFGLNVPRSVTRSPMNVKLRPSLPSGWSIARHTRRRRLAHRAALLLEARQVVQHLGSEGKMRFGATPRSRSRVGGPPACARGAAGRGRRVRGRRDATVLRLEEPKVSAGKRSSSREVCHCSGPTSDIPRRKRPFEMVGPRELFSNVGREICQCGSVSAEIFNIRGCDSRIASDGS